MLTIETTTNPRAVEIHRDGKSIGTVRRNYGGNEWELWIPSPDEVTIIPYDVLLIVTQFIGGFPCISPPRHTEPTTP